jgi:hypothetical protein
MSKTNSFHTFVLLVVAFASGSADGEIEYA